MLPLPTYAGSNGMCCSCFRRRDRDMVVRGGIIGRRQHTIFPPSVTPHAHRSSSPRGAHLACSGRTRSSGVMLLITLVGSYALGCFVSAYYLVRAVAGADVRGVGSGTAGARNTLRTHGRALGLAVLLLDAAKGALAVALAHRLVGMQWAEYLALACVIAGHVWPAQLQFRGGKGAASVVGGLVLADWRVSLLTLAIALVLLVTTRRVTRSGLTALAFVPHLVLFGSGVSVAVASILPIGLVLLAHRPHFGTSLPEVSP